jgi:hypothetical protein
MDPTRNPAADPHLGPHHQRSAVRLQQHLSHWLLLYAMSAIAHEAGRHLRLAAVLDAHEQDRG